MLEKLIPLLGSKFPEASFTEIENCTPAGLIVPKDRIAEICEFLHNEEDYYFDHLASLSGVDNGPEAGTMEVIYHLYSLPFDQHLTLKVILDRQNPKVDSITSIWRGANWHEREAFDLYGIKFNIHPDLRRILLPADWVGYPMRKDYVEDAQYHGMTIKHPDQLKDEGADV